MLDNNKKIFVSLVFILLTINNLKAIESNGNQSIEPSDTTIVTLSQDELISRNLFFELGGTSATIGLGYDQRFKPNSPFGFRAGLSFISGSKDNSGWFGAYDGGAYTRIDYKGVTFPLEVNAIMGRRASKFELGVGAVPFILHRYETTHWGWNSEHNEIKDVVRLNIFGAINIGYRLQRKRGFFLRTGLSFFIREKRSSPLDLIIFLPYLAIGYTIR